jgi:hypothetical protein
MKNKKAPILFPVGTLDTETTYFNRVWTVKVLTVKIDVCTGNRRWYVTQRKNFLCGEAAEMFVDEINSGW